MSALRPLPPRPSLEFEHKEAKALLRRLRAGDPEALARARARHPEIDTTPPASIRLAAAQLVIAREYGFTSWPRLVRYFVELDRQQSDRGLHAPNFYDSSVRGMLVEHRDRRVWVWRMLASYVPRFYGKHADEIFASTITEEDARLATARSYGAPSWEVLIERSTAQFRQRPGEWEANPMRAAARAMEAGDLDQLRRVVDAHPNLLLVSSDRSAPRGHNLFGYALELERQRGVEAMRPIVEWFTAQGLDLQRELNVRLCGHMRIQTDVVRHLLDRGADPNWIAPNGISVLEHALIRYWNGEASTLVGARAKVPKALWIAAGLGDVDGVRRFLDANGKPTPAARRFRPDFDAVGRGPWPSHPDPDDEEILMEAFVVAMFNDRASVMEYMASRGFSVDTLVYGSPLINVAVGNGLTRMVECLVRIGADLDLRGWRPHQSGREVARDMLEMMPDDVERQRIAALCGLDPYAILAERAASPAKPPGVAPELQTAMELAGDDAFRLGQSEILPENLLFGLLRGGGNPLGFFMWVSRMDVDRFRVDVASRVAPGAEGVEHPKLPLGAQAQAMVQAAIDFAKQRRHDTVHGMHLLHALTQSDRGVAELLERYGSSAAKLIAEIERAV